MALALESIDRIISLTSRNVNKKVVLPVVVMGAIGFLLTACAGPRLEDVQHRAATFKEIPADTHGKATIEVSEKGTLWALARRSDLPAAQSQKCTLDGAAFADARNDLNMPELRGAFKDGDKQTMFSFAKGQIDEPGSYEASCEAGSKPLLYVFEPKA